jgi:PTH1 family peptidyl-tRNA hydrolase
VKLVVGLGNPGRRYAATRHNVGFRIAERFCERSRLDLLARKFEGRFGRGTVLGVDVGVLLPETFMNLSGQSVAEALRLLPVGDPQSDLIVIFDDVDLPFGRIRIRPGGGAGGHKGLRDIIDKLGRDDFPRLRFGVGRPPHAGMDTADWVLQAFAADEESALGARLDEAAHALETMLRDGVVTAMNRFNRGGESASA